LNAALKALRHPKAKQECRKTLERSVEALRHPKAKLECRKTLGLYGLRMLSICRLACVQAARFGVAQRFSAAITSPSEAGFSL
jgi:hypothetical protein